MVTRFPGALDTIASMQPQGAGVQSAPTALMNALAAIVALETAILAGINLLLPQDGTIEATDAAGTGTLEIAAAGSFVDGMDTYDLLKLLLGKIVYDPNFNSLIAVLDGTTIVHSSDPTYDPATVTDGERSEYNPANQTNWGDDDGLATLYASGSEGAVRVKSGDAASEAILEATNGASGMIIELKGLPPYLALTQFRVAAVPNADVAAAVADGLVHLMWKP